MANKMLNVPMSFKPNNLTNIHDSKQYSSSTKSVNKPVNDENSIPTIDYSKLFSNDPDQRSKALHYLSIVCRDYGFFYLENHGVPHSIFESVLKGLSDFFDPTEVESRSLYKKKYPTDRIRWRPAASHEKNKELLKVVVQPIFHCPPKPAHFSVALKDYTARLRDLELGLAKALSRALGFEECFIEKALNLKSGFDVFVTNIFPPNSESESSMGLVDHTDPGMFVSVIQDVDGGLQIFHNGKWLDVNAHPNSIFIYFTDHLEILTNGKCKSIVHRPVVGDNKLRRIIAAIMHGPSLETFVKPAVEFVDDSHPPAYRGMTYKQSLEANGFDELDIRSSLQQIRVPNI